MAIGGQPLPITYPGAGTVTGGHYLLATDGTYAFQYERDGEPAPQTALLCANARYMVGSSTIDFYLALGGYPLSAFYQQRNGHFATASVSGRVMLVKYEDTIDFADEQYELKSGFDPIVFPARALSR